MADPSTRKSALLVVDVQNAVMQSAWQADEVVERIAVVIQRARDAGAPVVYVQHEEDGGMERGSSGWRIVEAIAPRDGDALVGKRFQDSFAETTLGETLEALDIGHLVVVGAQTDACIRATTMRTLIEGYDLTLVEDCHTTEDTAFDMTDGEKVDISAKQIVAHTNLCIWSLRYPGRTSMIEPHDQVQFIT